jgi:hypothetical protein
VITIHKYLVGPIVELPTGAEILTLDVQNGLPMIWALVDTDKGIDPKEFRVVGTGESLPPDTNRDTYIGTWQLGPFVWHLFEVQR